MIHSSLSIVTKKFQEVYTPEEILTVDFLIPWIPTQKDTHVDLEQNTQWEAPNSSASPLPGSVSDIYKSKQMLGSFLSTM
jgi:hypothetical protein